MENPRDQAIARLKEANNVLVTVSVNPTVDQLAGAIGLGLLLNKLGKHATAVFSGIAPSTLEFLKPEDTLKKDTDSLRDFIISLDKAKADKLRYKVEDQHVKIFITPYHTSLSQDDLEYSQGDFNVDTVIALGVHQQSELDQAIAAHGRILHDSTTISINTSGTAELGSINWVDQQASSLCEMISGLGSAMQANIFDAPIATALLTGIVAETQRFSNQKTTSLTMNISAALMSAGANQQLVATKLNEDHVLTSNQPASPGSTQTPAPDPQVQAQAGGALSIDHPVHIPKTPPNTPSMQSSPMPALDEDEGEHPLNTDNQIHIDDHGNMLQKLKEVTEEAENPIHDKGITPPEQPHLKSSQNESHRVTDPPSLGGTLTANAEPQSASSSDSLSLPPLEGPILTHNSSAQPQHEQSSLKETPITNSESTPNTGKTLTDIEKSVSSPHLQTDQNRQIPTNDSTSGDAPPPVPPPMMPPAPQFGQQPLPNAENDNDSQDPLTAI
jgi:hypothetical protein